MAHPLRIRILSLTTGAGMSASEIADELGIAHAAASYHARQLANAGLLRVVNDSGKRTGPGRPLVRYRYVARLTPRLGRSVGDEALWAALTQDLERRLRARSSKHVGADAEVWMAPGDFAEVRALAQQIADLIHERARPPHARGTIHGSVTALAFKLGNVRARR